MKQLKKLVLHAALTAAVMTAGTAGATTKTVADNINTVGSQPVTFLSGSNKVAANLYLPEGFKTGEKYPAIVVVTPGVVSKNKRQVFMPKNSLNRGL